MAEKATWHFCELGEKVVRAMFLEAFAEEIIPERAAGLTRGWSDGTRGRGPEGVVGRFNTEEGCETRRGFCRV